MPNHFPQPPTSPILEAGMRVVALYATASPSEVTELRSILQPVIDDASGDGEYQPTAGDMKDQVNRA